MSELDLQKIRSLIYNLLVTNSAVWHHNIGQFWLYILVSPPRMSSLNSGLIDASVFASSA